MATLSCREAVHLTLEHRWTRRERANENDYASSALEARLRKVPVARQRLGQSFVRHHDEGDAIRQRPILVCVHDWSAGIPTMVAG